MANKKAQKKTGKPDNLESIEMSLNIFFEYIQAGQSLQKALHKINEERLNLGFNKIATHEIFKHIAKNPHYLEQYEIARQFLAERYSYRLFDILEKLESGELDAATSREIRAVLETIMKNFNPKRFDRPKQNQDSLDGEAQNVLDTMPDETKTKWLQHTKKRRKVVDGSVIDAAD